MQQQFDIQCGNWQTLDIKYMVYTFFRRDHNRLKITQFNFLSFRSANHAPGNHPAFYWKLTSS